MTLPTDIQAAIDNLRAFARGEISPLHLHRYEEDVEVLASHCEALEKDAARYRHLLDKGLPTYLKDDDENYLDTIVDTAIAGAQKS